MVTHVSPQTTTARLPWLIIICGCLIALMTFGPRSAMGFFQLPMLAEKGWDRTTFGLAMAIQNLAWGLGTPIFGAYCASTALGACWRCPASCTPAASPHGRVDLSDAAAHRRRRAGGLGVASGSFGIISQPLPAMSRRSSAASSSASAQRPLHRHVPVRR